MSSREKLAIHGGTPVRTDPLPYARQSVDADDVRAVLEVLGSDWLTTGPRVETFERALAEFLDVAFVVAVSSGTAALHAAVHAIGIEPGDEVLVPTMTFVATSNAVVFQGGTPIFVDVLPDSLLMDPADAARKVTPHTRALLPVEYAGQPCDHGALDDLAHEAGLKTLIDACHAIGGAYRGKRIGSFGDLTCFSFHPAKHVTTGEGGAITTGDAHLAQRMRRFRNHGLTTDHRERKEAGSYSYEMVEIGYNYRLTDIQCALGITQMRKLDRWVERRREIAKRYDEGFAEIEGVEPLSRNPDGTHAYHLYVVLLDLDGLTVGRDAVFAALRAEGIGVNVHYMPVHLQPFYRDRLGTGRGDCPVAEAASERILTVPLFPAMTDADVASVLEAFSRVLGAYRP